MCSFVRSSPEVLSHIGIIRNHLSVSSRFSGGSYANAVCLPWISLGILKRLLEILDDALKHFSSHQLFEFGAVE